MAYPRMMANWMKMIEEGREPHWGDVANLRSSNIEEYGLEGALRMNRNREPSEHRSSSGKTSEVIRALAAEGRSRKERNTWRREHYRRKGELEGAKEVQRRAEWARRHGSRAESGFQRKEATRKARRALNRAIRKASRKAGGGK